MNRISVLRAAPALAALFLAAHALALPTQARAQRIGPVERVTITGRVLDAFTGEPVRGAIVELFPGGMRFITDVAGRFVLDAATGSYRLELAHPLYHPAAGDFAIMRPGEFTTHMEPLERTGPGYEDVDELMTGVSGVIVGAGGNPVAGATVTMRAEGTAQQAAGASVQTDVRGRFMVDDLLPGPLQLEFAQIGYAPRTDQVDVVLGRVTNIRVALSPDPVELAPIEVEVERREVVLQDVGFYSRELEGFGEFVDREAIENWRPVEVTDIFSRLPGVELFADPNNPLEEYIVLRGGRQSSFMSGSYGRCFPRVVLDGVIINQGGNDPAVLDRLIEPEAIAGVEVFPTSAGVPAQYAGTGASCGAVLLWTRR